MPVAADLLAGDEDPRSSVVELIQRAHASLPPGIGQVALRMDAGYFAADAAIAADDLQMVFAIGVKRNAAVWRAAATVPASGYVPVIGMDDTEVAVIPYAPKGWPAQIVCLARRTLVNLLSNALRRSPADTPPLVTVSGHADEVQIRVIDHGPGVDVAD